MHNSSAVETKEITSVSATPAAQPSAAVNGDFPAGQGTVLLFSLAFREGPAGALSWSTELPVVQMLADLVAASSAITVADSEGVLTAAVPGSIEAVVLAIRARKLAEAYSRHAGDDLHGIAIGILAQSANGESQQAALRTYIESRANSWQVFLTGQTYKLLNSTPGLQFRKLPAAPGPRLDLHELVLPPVSQAATPITTETIPVVAAPAAVPADMLRLQHEDVKAAPRGNLKLILGGVAAVVVVGALLVLKPWVSHAPPPAARPVEAPASVATPPAASPAAESATPAPAKPAAAEKVREAAAKSAAPAATAKPAAKPPALEAQHEQPTHGGGGYTAEQLQAILDKADALSANGKYDDAIRNYNVVLASDPGNARARAGKERALSNKSLK